MNEALPDDRVDLISVVLAGCWRNVNLNLLNISESQLNEVTPLLCGSGAGALGWWRVRQSEFRTTASAAILQQMYRLQTLQSEVAAENISKVFLLLREASIEPILIKGWAASSLYPVHGLRPWGDIDLLVQPRDYKAAAKLLAGPEAKECWTDLQQKSFELADRSIEQLFERSKLVPLSDGTVRVLSPEDHLALLAVHLLKHGAWRPLWLCDIAAALEALPPTFDWDICLGPTERRADWIKIAIWLASVLLEARTDDLPASIKKCEPPRFVMATVRKEWQNPVASNHPQISIALQLKAPGGLLKALQQRWPNPILATVSVDGTFNGLPRWPYKVGTCALRAARLLRRP